MHHLTPGARTAMRLLAACCLSLAPGLAGAQPDPFAAYDMERSAAVDPGALPLPGGDARVMTTAGTLTAALNGVFNLTQSTNGLIGGGERRHSTFYTHISPTIGWYVFDRLELRFAPGLIWRDLDRGDDGTATERAWIVDAGARYHVVLSSKLAVHVGVALGGYFGSSSRKIEIVELVDGEERPRTLGEATSTAGFSLDGGVGLGIVLTPELVLDAGVDLRWLIGSESIESEGESLASSLVNTGLTLGLRYVF